MRRALVVRDILSCAGARLAALLRSTRSAAISRSAFAVGRGVIAARRPFARVAGGRFGPAGGARVGVASPRRRARRAWSWSTGGIAPRLPYECQSDHGTAESARCSEYARKGECRALLEPRRYCIDRHEWPNLVGENPRVYVSWFQAKELCWNVGKRLCRRSEWMLACEGPKRLPYPYGFARQPSPCNIDRSSIPFDIDAMINPETREAELTRLWQADPIGSHPAMRQPGGRFRYDRQRRRVDRQPGRRSARPTRSRR